jgi:dienelactone hydrolase
MALRNGTRELVGPQHDGSAPHVYISEPQGEVRAVVIVIHGGRERSDLATTERQVAVLRMRPFATRLHRRLSGDGVAVWRLRLALRGWNDDAPLEDAKWALDAARERYGAAVPVVLVGHSMGGRVSVRSADFPTVAGVVGLAPWLPAGEPVEHLAGRRLVFFHGVQDRIVPTRQSVDYAERARLIAGEVRHVPVRYAGHGMLRRASYWHRCAADAVADLLSSERSGSPNP